MRLVLGAIPMRGLLAAVCLLAVQSLVAPSGAQASCGDYVMLGSHHSGHASGNAGDQAGHSKSPAMPYCPCQGATCSKGDFPVAPPAPRVSSRFDHWACQFGRIELSIDFSLTLLAIESSPQGTFSGLSIFRPPRVG